MKIFLKIRSIFDRISYPDNSSEKRNNNISPKLEEKLALAPFLVIALAFLLLWGRVFSLKVKNGPVYEKKILENINYDTAESAYKRGDILDRNGTPLAVSKESYRIILNPVDILEGQDDEKKKKRAEDNLEMTSKVLAETFGYDQQMIKDRINEYKDRRYYRLDAGITSEQKESFDANKETAEKDQRTSGKVIGVSFEKTYQRSYPNNALACDVIGFSQGDGDVGTGGIEQFYNSNLIGKEGKKYGYFNEDVGPNQVIKSAEDGDQIVSTIDINIQRIVEKHIQEWESSTGSKRTAVLVMNPNNGEILALATSKGYDLNHPRDLTKFYQQADIDKMDDKKKNDALNEIWRNFAVSDTYEPGSPSKVFTVAAGLEEGVIKGNETYFCDGFQKIGKWTIKCVSVHGHGLLTVTGALMQSCNDALMQIGAAIGVERFTKYQKIFGFGEMTGVDLPGEADTKGLIHTAQNMSAVDLATNSFGQNYNTTMVQTAAAFCSVINGGSYYRPHVAKQILSANGAVKENLDGKVVRETVSMETTEFLREALRKTVAEGTGSAAQVPGYDIGGKTGTAEKYPRGKGKYLVSFAGFAPTQNPEVFCYVIIDEPHVADQAHSTYASTLFKDIMTEVLPYMNLFPNSTNTEEDSIKAGMPKDNGITVVPDVSQKSETDEYVPQILQIPDGLPEAAQTTAASGLTVQDDEQETLPKQSETSQSAADTSATETSAADTSTGETSGANSTTATAESTAVATTVAETQATTQTSAETQAQTSAAATTAKPKAAKSKAKTTKKSVGAKSAPKKATTAKKPVKTTKKAR